MFETERETIVFCFEYSNIRISSFKEYMASKKKPYVKLQCTGCKNINYFAHKSKGAEGKLELQKFCKIERKHTKHKEAKK